MGAEPLRAIEGGAAPRGWERLWPRDVWCRSELPHGDLSSSYRGEEMLRFERICQPWLKEAAKRWARARLLGDTAPRTMSAIWSASGIQPVAGRARARGERARAAVAPGA